MTRLSAHVQALRAEAEALAFVANECGDDRNALLMTRLSEAKSRAAQSLEDAERRLNESTYG